MPLYNKVSFDSEIRRLGLDKVYSFGQGDWGEPIVFQGLGSPRHYRFVDLQSDRTSLQLIVNIHLLRGKGIFLAVRMHPGI